VLMANVVEMPPRGHYLANEVGLLAGVSGERIGQWARRKYIRASQSMANPHVYSYQDVGEAMVVHELLDLGADLRSIKRTIGRLREREGLDWPLQRHRSDLDAYHGTVIEHGDDGRAYDIGGKRSAEQVVLDDRNLTKIAGELERGGWAARIVPDLKYIEVNPDRLGGRPVIRGRRIAADEVARIANMPDGIDILRKDYEISAPEARDAKRWWDVVHKFATAA
jgi:uncharacterized protein (DUF433 family)